MMKATISFISASAAKFGHPATLRPGHAVSPRNSRPPRAAVTRDEISTLFGAELYGHRRH